MPQAVQVQVQVQALTSSPEQVQPSGWRPQQVLAVPLTSPRAPQRESVPVQQPATRQVVTSSPQEVL